MDDPKTEGQVTMTETNPKETEYGKYVRTQRESRAYREMDMDTETDEEEEEKEMADPECGGEQDRNEPQPRLSTMVKGIPWWCHGKNFPRRKAKTKPGEDKLIETRIEEEDPDQVEPHPGVTWDSEKGKKRWCSNKQWCPVQNFPETKPSATCYKHLEERKLKRKKQREEDRETEQAREKEMMEGKRPRGGNGGNGDNRRIADEKDKDEYMRNQVTRISSEYALLGSWGGGSDDDGVSAFIRTTKNQGGQP